MEFLPKFLSVKCGHRLVRSCVNSTACHAGPTQLRSSHEITSTSIGIRRGYRNWFTHCTTRIPPRAAGRASSDGATMGTLCDRSASRHGKRKRRRLYTPQRGLRRHVLRAGRNQRQKDHAGDKHTTDGDRLGPLPGGSWRLGAARDIPRVSRWIGAGACDADTALPKWGLLCLGCVSEVRGGLPFDSWTR